MAKIVVLDGFALNPGDLSWSEIERLGELTVYPRTAPEEFDERAKGAEILLTNKTVIDAERMARLPSLRYISVLATGYNVVDGKAARARGIPVSNVPGYSTESVVQSAIGHLLNLAQGLAEHTAAVRSGQWSSAPDFCFFNRSLTELSGKRLGVVGFGTIGRRVAAVARALGMETVAYGPRLTVGKDYDGTMAVTLDVLFRTSDAVTLHCPLTAENERLINASRLASMKRTAFFINTARGGLVDEAALAEALNQGQIAGAGLDVLSAEPPLSDSPLLTARNCFITPHNAWATLDARKRLMAATVANVRAFVEGTPQNVVNI